MASRIQRWSITLAAAAVLFVGIGGALSHRAIRAQIVARGLYSEDEETRSDTVEALAELGYHGRMEMFRAMCSDDGEIGLDAQIGLFRYEQDRVDQGGDGRFLPRRARLH